MTLKFFISILAFVIVALIGLLSFLFVFPPSINTPHAKPKPETTKSDNSYKSPSVQYTAPADDKPSAPNLAPTTYAQPVTQLPSASNGPYGEKQAVMDRIQEAISTYSAEGVPVLKPLLTSPDLEIREHAIEAMKQLDAPEAAAALREVANKTTDPRDRQAMLEAADFVDLPAYQPRK
jgi:hypothetical protein